MIPKVTSLPSLSAAASVRSAWRNANSGRADRDSPAPHSRRRSLDAGASRPKSRPGSSADLVALEHAAGGASGAEPHPIPVSRPVSPAPALWTVAESPCVTPFGSYNADAELPPFPTKFFAPPLLPSTSPSATFAPSNTEPHGFNATDKNHASALDGMVAATASPLQSPPSAAADDEDVLACACGQMEDDVATGAFPTPASDAAAAITMADSAPSSFVIAAAAAKAPTSSAAPDLERVETIAPPILTGLSANKGAASKKVAALKAALNPSPRTSPPALLLPPAPHEVHVYHAHANLAFVQELLSNLAHVQHMFKATAASGSGSAAASAGAAARMLSRSLSRAAQRVRTMCLGTFPACPKLTPEEAAERVLLAHEALHTLPEYGFAELLTCDAERARALGALDLEVHDLLTGRVASYHRKAPDQPWVHVGVSPGSTSARAVCGLLGPNSPLGPLSRTCSSILDPADDASSASSWPTPPSPASSEGGSAVGGWPERVQVAGGGAGVGMTVARFAQQLHDAGASVLAASDLLQQWLDELRATTDAAMADAAMAFPSCTSPCDAQGAGGSQLLPAV